MPLGVAGNEPHRARSVFIAAVFNLMKAMDEVCKWTRARRPKADEQVYNVAASSKTTGIRNGSPARRVPKSANHRPRRALVDGVPRWPHRRRVGAAGEGSVIGCDQPREGSEANGGVSGCWRSGSGFGRCPSRPFTSARTTSCGSVRCKEPHRIGCRDRLSHVALQYRS